MYVYLHGRHLVNQAHSSNPAPVHSLSPANLKKDRLIQVHTTFFLMQPPDPLRNADPVPALQLLTMNRASSGITPGLSEVGPTVQITFGCGWSPVAWDGRCHWIGPVLQSIASFDAILFHGLDRLREF